MIIIVIVCVCAQCMIKNTTWSRWFSYFVGSATAAAAATAAAVIVVVVAIFDVLNAIILVVCYDYCFKSVKLHMLWIKANELCFFLDWCKKPLNECVQFEERKIYNEITKSNTQYIIHLYTRWAAPTCVLYSIVYECQTFYSRYYAKAYIHIYIYV